MENYQIFDFGLLHLEWSNAVFVLYVFLVVMVGLSLWLFYPVLRTLEIRQQITKKQEDNQKIAEKACLELELECQEKLNKAEQETQYLLEATRRKQQEQAKHSFKTAQAELTEQLEQQKQEAEQWFKTEQELLPALAEGLAEQLYHKIYDSKI